MANAPTQSDLTVKEVAAELNMPDRTVRDLINRFKLKAYDVSQCPGDGNPRWRVTPGAIADFKDKRTHRPADQPKARRAVRRPSTQYV